MNVSIAMHHAPLAALIPTTCSSELSRHAFGYLHRCRRAAKSLVAALPPVVLVVRRGHLRAVPDLLARPGALLLGVDARRPRPVGYRGQPGAGRLLLRLGRRWGQMPELRGSWLQSLGLCYCNNIAISRRYGFGVTDMFFISETPLNMGLPALKSAVG